MSETKARKHRTADKTIAATAGADDWKTWSGRKHGTGDFQVFDLFRGMKRSLHKRFLAGPPPAGSTCPVCFTEPDRWFITSSCAHAVCFDCIKAYAASQVRDREHVGPLKCPVCPQHLRTSDTIAILGNDKDLIKSWDLKIRDQLLRALPSFRSCPNCTNNENNGGGFVTPECLSPHYQKCREDASFWIYQGIPTTRFIVFMLYIFHVRYISKHPSKFPAVDLFFMITLLYVILFQFGRAALWQIAELARKDFYRSVAVECPCCTASFILPSESSHLEDEETKNWMDANTRRCPSCSVPITKNGGCNHMRCSHCNASFCWQCMRMRTTCTHNRCRYNPRVNTSAASVTNEPPNDSILSRMDYHLGRESPHLGVWFVFTLAALFARDHWLITSPVGLIMTLITAVPFSLLYGLFIVIIPLYHAYNNTNRRDIGNRHHQNLIAEELENIQRHETNQRNVGYGAIEEAMIAQAVRQSLIEQERLNYPQNSQHAN